MKRLLCCGLLMLCVAGRGTAQPNTLTRAERADGWRLLFDGRSFAGWRGLGYDSVPSAHWRIANATIMKIASGNVPKIADGQPAAGGDLMSVDTFQDFELAWEFKLTPKSNTGVKYNVSEEFSVTHASNHAALGWEFQLQDDSLGEDIANPSHRTGSLYEMIPANAGTLVKSVGQWNSARLVFRGNKGEHWLNGRKVVEFDITTTDFAARLAKSKYRTIPGFADRRRGHVILQDHGDEVYFRSIKVRELRANASH